MPAYPDETLAGLSPEQLIELLIRDEGRVPRNALLDFPRERHHPLLADLAARQDRWAEEAARGDGDFADDNDLPYDKPDVPYIRFTEKVGRNDPCPCGSGRKFKQCCLAKEQG